MELSNESVQEDANRIIIDQSCLPVTDGIKKKTLAYKDRLLIVQSFRSGTSRQDLMSQYNLTASTLTNILKAKDKVLLANESNINMLTKRIRISPFEQVNEKLVEFIDEAKEFGLKINGTIIRDVGLELALKMGVEGFNASNGWLGNIKRKHSIAFRKDKKEDYDLELLSRYFIALPTIVKDYQPKDIYSLALSSFLFDSLIEKLKNKVTCLFCCNMDGSHKLIPLIIGKSKHPKEFNSTIPNNYTNHRKTWCTQTIFIKWVKKLDLELVDENRKILLLLSNSTAHPKSKKLDLKNIKLVYLPPRQIDRLNPLHLGIIAFIKHSYRSQLINQFTHHHDNSLTYQLPNLLEFIQIITKLWYQVPNQVIEQSFQSSGVNKEWTIDPNISEEDLLIRSITFQPKQTTMLPIIHNVELPIPNNWTKFTQLTNINFTFNEYLDLDSNLPTEEKMTLDLLIDQTLDLNIQSENKEEHIEVEREDIPIDQAIIILHELLNKDSNIPKDALEALNYLENFIKNCYLI